MWEVIVGLPKKAMLSDKMHLVGLPLIPPRIFHSEENALAEANKQSALNSYWNYSIVKRS